MKSIVFAAGLITIMNWTVLSQSGTDSLTVSKAAIRETIRRIEIGEAYEKAYNLLKEECERRAKETLEATAQQAINDQKTKEAKEETTRLKRENERLNKRNKSTIFGMNVVAALAFVAGMLFAN